MNIGMAQEPELWKQRATKLLKHFLNSRHILESLRNLRALGSEELVQFARASQPDVDPSAVAAWQSFLTEFLIRVGIIARCDKGGTTIPTFGSPKETTITPYVESMIRFVAAEAHILYRNDKKVETFLAGHAYTPEAPVPDTILFRRPHLPTSFPYFKYAKDLGAQPDDVLLVVEAKKANVVPCAGAHPVDLTSIPISQYNAQAAQAQQFREALNQRNPPSGAARHPTSSHRPSRLDYHTQLYSFALLHNACYNSDSPLQQRNDSPFLGLLTTMEDFWFMWSDSQFVDRGFCAAPVHFPFLDLFNHFFKCYRELPPNNDSPNIVEAWLAELEAKKAEIPVDKLALGEAGIDSTASFYCEELYTAARTNTAIQKMARTFMNSPNKPGTLSWDEPPDIFLLLLALPFHDLSQLALGNTPDNPTDSLTGPSDRSRKRRREEDENDDDDYKDEKAFEPPHKRPGRPGGPGSQQRGSHAGGSRRNIGVVCDRALPGDAIVPKGVCANFRLHPFPYNTSIPKPSRERSSPSFAALGEMTPTTGVEELANELKSGVCVKVLSDVEAYETEVTTLIHAANKNCTVTPRIVCCGQVEEAQGFGEQSGRLYAVVTDFVGYPLFGDREIFEKMNTPEWEQMKKEEAYKCRLKWFELQLHPKDTPELWNALQECLKELRRCGIVHGDLKPDHFMVDPQDGKIKLIDFGSSEVIESYYIDESAPTYDRVRFNYGREPKDHLLKAVTPHFASKRINSCLRGGRDFRGIPSDDVASAFYSLMHWLIHEAPLESRELGSPDPTISPQFQLYFAILGDIHPQYHLVPTVARQYLEPISESVRKELSGLPRLGLPVPIPGHELNDTTSLQIPLVDAPLARKRCLYGTSHRDNTAHQQKSAWM